VLNSQFKTQRVDIDVEAAEPSLVVVAQTYYHDWRVYVDDQPAQLLRANYAFQAFQVSGGRHHVWLVYEDRVFPFGAAVSVCMVVNCLIFLRWLSRRTPPVTMKGSH
jgi:uncharacterized membrane protein YfhO